jgi:hypothetical protein
VTGSPPEETVPLSAYVGALASVKSRVSEPPAAIVNSAVWPTKP